MSILSYEQEKLLNKLLGQKTEENIYTIQTGGEGFPLSSSQLQLWIFDRINPGSSAYNIPIAIRISGDLNIEALQYSFNKIIQRHEILRTNFKEDGNSNVIQEVNRMYNFELKVKKFDNEQKAKVWITKESNKSMNLTKDRLFSVNLLKIKDNDFILYLKMHHVISDGWSISLLFQELSICYKAYTNKESLTLQDIKVQYLDYARWQQNKIDNNVFNNQLKYWEKKLSGIDDVLNLPIDRNRPKNQTNNGAEYRFEIPKRVAKEIINNSKETHTTLFIWLLTAYKIFLSRITDQNDIIIGSPTSNRNTEDTENLIGFLANTLALRTNIDKNLTFKDILKDVKSTVKEAFDNQQIPFDIVLNRLTVERNTSHTPVFQTMFALQDEMSVDLELSNLDLNELEVERESSKYDITLFVTKCDDIFKLTMEYNTDLFDETSIERMSENFLIFLNNLILNPDEQVKDLSIITNIEYEKIINEWNGTTSEIPQKSIIELFNEQVLDTPNKRAVTCDKQHMTYKDLDLASNKLANYISRNFDIKINDVIGICLNKSINTIIGLLAILKSGAAYLPLDPAYPKQRLDNMIEESKVSVIITEEQIKNNLKFDELNIIVVDDKHRDKIDKSPNTRILINRCSDDLAYINFTSGSTGKAKGVMVSQEGVVSLVKNTNYVNFVDEVFMHYSTLSFDAATFEIWGSLLNGSRIVIFPDRFIDLNKLGSLIDTENVTTMFITTALFNQVVDDHIQKFSKLQQLLTGGEKMSIPHIKKAVLHFGNCRIANVYGPTECTTFSTIYNLSENNINYNSIPIGKPIANTYIYILDSNKEPVPIGTRGEIHIGGAGVAIGYLNRKELTDEKFIVNPFNSSGKSYIYSTGDIARYLPNGDIEFLGRLDKQVKIRGHRIEPDEINEVIRNQESVINSITIPILHQDEYKIVSYYTTSQKNLCSSELNSLLKEQLPPYMIPWKLVLLDALPVTLNGKIDLKKLPSRFDEDEKVIDLPINNTQVKLLEIWEQVLSRKDIGINDTFFSLGGHSLDATKTISRINDQLNIKIPVSIIFELQTITELGSYIDDNIFKESPNIPLLNIKKYNISFGQQSFWFQYLLNEQNSLGGLLGFSLKGLLNVSTFQEAITDVADRHNIMKTFFCEEGGVVYQEVDDKMKLDFEFTDLSSLNPKDRITTLDKLIIQLRNTPYKLKTGPLFRFRIIKLDLKEYMLLICAHHIVYDGWSLNNIIKEISLFYNKRKKKIPNTTLTQPLQYIDFVAWQENLLNVGAFDEAKEYWESQLKNVSEPIKIPLESMNSLDKFVNTPLKYILEENLSDKLKHLSRDLNVTPFVIMVTALNIWLSKLTGENDITLGTPLSGRVTSQLEDVVGLLINTIPLRNSLAGNPTIIDIIRNVNKTFVAGTKHQSFPFELITKDLKSKSVIPYSIVIVGQNVFDATINLEGISSFYLSSESISEKYNQEIKDDKKSEDNIDLLIEMKDGIKSVELLYDFNSKFTNRQVESMCSQIESILWDIVKKPETRLLQLVSENTFEDEVNNLF